MSTSTQEIIKKIIGIIFILAGFAWPCSGQEQPKESVKLWNESTPKGQWRAFGSGVEDSARLTDGEGLKIIVDWSKITFGVGAIYAKNSQEPNSDEVPLPHLSGFQKIQIEVRCGVADETSVLLEFASRAEGKEYRALPSLAKTITQDWQIVEFTIPGDFQKMDDEVMLSIDAARILFLNPSKAGKNTLEFRNAVLRP